MSSISTLTEVFKQSDHPVLTQNVPTQNVPTQNRFINSAANLILLMLPHLDLDDFTDESFNKLKFFYKEYKESAIELNLIKQTDETDI